MRTTRAGALDVLCRSHDNIPPPTLHLRDSLARGCFSSGLEDLESVDETAIVYIRSAHEFGSLNLLPPVLAQASQDIEAAMRKACFCTEFVADLLQIQCHLCCAYRACNTRHRGQHLPFMM